LYIWLFLAKSAFYKFLHFSITMVYLLLRMAKIYSTIDICFKDDVALIIRIIPSMQLGSAWGCKMKCRVALFFSLFTTKIILTRLFYSCYLTINCYYWQKAKWNWGLTQQNSFWRIQSAIVCQVLLMYSNFNKNFDINKNASGFQLGAVISQNSWPDAFFL
jgi:hypothetical protein